MPTFMTGSLEGQSQSVGLTLQSSREIFDFCLFHGWRAARGGITQPQAHDQRLLALRIMMSTGGPLPRLCFPLCTLVSCHLFCAASMRGTSAEHATGVQLHTSGETRRRAACLHAVGDADALRDRRTARLKRRAAGWGQPQLHEFWHRSLRVHETLGRVHIVALFTVPAARGRRGQCYTCTGFYRGRGRC